MGPSMAEVELDDEAAIRGGIVDILLAISKGSPTMEQMKRARECVESAAQILRNE
jgi:hypothetical protein